MPVEQVQLQSTQPYWDGHEFGSTGAYRRIDGVLHYAVDPAAPGNRDIVDLALANRDDDGLVRFHGELTVLMPADPSRGNRSLLVEVPNRGRTITSYLNQDHQPGPMNLDPRIAPLDGYLMEQGWCMAWIGWQWDVPETPERLRIGLTPPQVPTDRRDDELPMQLRLLLSQSVPHVALTDQHVGPLGGHRPIAPRDPDAAGSRLLVRDSVQGNAQEIPRDQWSFGRLVSGKVVPDSNHVCLQGGFQAGRIYDLIYHPRDCPVVGAGLLAVREASAWLRYGDESPVRDAIETVIGEGVSQCGRFLRHFLKLGLNRYEANRPVFDGVLAHVAGARVGEFNHRHAQPSVQPTPSLGHRFPFADAPQTDPLTGETAGLLDRQQAIGCMPRIMFTDTAAEYWRGDAALAHTNLSSDEQADQEPPDNVRRYLFAGTQHIPGQATFTRDCTLGGQGGNWMNTLEWRPLYRACLENLREWIVNGTEPPASQFPRASDNTRMRRADVMQALSVIPGMALPDPAQLNTMRPLDLGDRTDDGQAALPARFLPGVYPDWVAAVDADGNEVAGIRMPDQTVPVATHTGFNPRHADNGGTGMLLEYFGSSIPFAASPQERATTDDPRPSIAERYDSIDDYLARVRNAAQRLVDQRFLLKRDIDLCVELARLRYLAATS